MVTSVGVEFGSPGIIHAKVHLGFHQSPHRLMHDDSVFIDSF